MKIIVVGDFHIMNSEETEKAVDDIIKLNPDIVVTLGDYGSNKNIGTPNGLYEASKYLKKIPCKIFPILGNHDLQSESGKNIQTPFTMEKTLCTLYNISSSYSVIELGDFRLILLTVEPQEENECIYVQECFLSRKQLEWLSITLSEKKDTPTIIFSHSPPVASGLQTVREVHVRAINAYLNHNHNPYELIEILQKNPQIYAWFSAHFHLGHSHNTSMSKKYNTYFFNTGVHASVCRDNERQSRIIEISGNEMMVSTLDHKKREITYEYDKKIVFGNKEDLDMCKCGIDYNIICDFEVDLGHMMVKDICLADKETLYISTKDNFLWEINLQITDITGTLHYSNEPVDLFAADKLLVWKIYGKNKLSVTKRNSFDRFHRGDGFQYFEKIMSLPFKADNIYIDGQSRCLISSGGKMYDAEFRDGEIYLSENMVSSRQEKICIQEKHAFFSDGKITVQDSDKALSIYTDDGYVYLTHILTTDCEGNQVLVIIYQKDDLSSRNRIVVWLLTDNKKEGII